VLADRCNRAPGAAAANASAQFEALAPDLAEGPLALISGASGAGPATAEEREFLAALDSRRPGIAVRGTAAAIGHSLEAAFPANLILAISCLQHRTVFAPLTPGEPIEAAAAGPISQALVTGWGHHRGEGMALVERVE
jgi:3-oxoacyl-[acyl-carrier-protein] synthase II